MEKLSIVIPTLNEAHGLKNTILHTLEVAHHKEGLEVLVVDSGSVDGTLETIAGLNVCSFSQPELKGNKSAILNYGYQHAKGQVIMFLDADTLLPDSFDQLIKVALASEKVVGGAFDFEFQEKHWYLLGLALINRIRIRIDYNFLGDQAVFCRKQTLDSLGGYPDKLIMESSFLCQALKTQGKMCLIPARIRTSARRFLENGFLKVFWFDFRVWVFYVLGLDVERFGKSYWQHNDTAPES